MHSLKMQPFVPPAGQQTAGRKHLIYNMLIVGVQGVGKYCLHHQVRIPGSTWIPLRQHEESKPVFLEPNSASENEGMCQRAVSSTETLAELQS